MEIVLPGLPKSYIKKYGISKQAWREFRKAKKGRKSSSKKKVKKVARRRRGRYRAKRRRRRDKRISLIGTAGAVGSVFIPRRPEQASMGQWLKEWAMQERPFDTKEVNDFLADTVGQYTGFDWRKDQPQWSIPWATVAIVASAFAARIANKYGGKYLKNVPFVGKYIKF